MKFYAFAILVGALIALQCRAEDPTTNTTTTTVAAPVQLKYAAYPDEIPKPNYTTPYNSRLDEFRTSQTIHIIGDIKSDAVRIDVNLRRSNASDGNICFHLSIRFDEGFFHLKAILNDFQDGQWQKEHRVNNLFKAGEQMDLRIRLYNHTYYVYANGEQMAVFEERQELDENPLIEINGEVNVTHVSVDGASYTLPITMATKIDVGKRLDWFGVPTGEQFGFSLFEDNSDAAEPIPCLDISVNFDSERIVFNSKNSSGWAVEEVAEGFPVQKGHIVNFVVVNEQNQFKIMIDGEFFATYAHRPNLNANLLEINGDIDVYGIFVNEAVPLNRQK